MSIRSVSPVSVVRAEVWTYDKQAPKPKRVPVLAHRTATGQWAAGRFGNGARR